MWPAERSAHEAPRRDPDVGGLTVPDPAPVKGGSGTPPLPRENHGRDLATGAPTRPAPRKTGNLTT